VHPTGTVVYVTGDTRISVIATATNTVVATVPVGNPPTAFGQFVGPELLGGSLTLNQATVHGGNTLTLRATTYAGTAPRPVDAYVEVHLPDETRFFVQGDGRLTREIRPIVSDWLVEPFSGEIFRYTFGGGEPVGITSGRLTSPSREPPTSSASLLEPNSPSNLRTRSRRTRERSHGHLLWYRAASLADTPTGPAWPSPTRRRL